MSANNKKLVAVIGATGQQGGGVVRALQASGQFKVRALSRNPGKHRDLANGVVEADLNRPDTSEIVDALNRQGHNFSFTQVPADVCATLFPGAAYIAATRR